MKVLLPLLAAMLLLSCKDDAATPATRVEPAAISADDAMPALPKRFEELIAAANAGDLSAAATLSVFYGAAGDNEASFGWLLHGARRGDCNAIRTLRSDPRLAAEPHAEELSRLLEQLAAATQCDRSQEK